MGKFRKGKILVIAILMMITSFFAFTGKVSAAESGWKLYCNEVKKIECANHPVIHTYINGVEFNPSDAITKNTNGVQSQSRTYNSNREEVIYSFSLPESIPNFGQNEMNRNPIIVDGMGIQGWYDNPEFEGKPITGTIDISKYKDDDSVELSFYAKLGPIINIYVDGIRRPVVVGRKYNVTYLDGMYEVATGKDTNYRNGFAEDEGTQFFEHNNVYRPNASDKQYYRDVNHGKNCYTYYSCGTFKRQERADDNYVHTDNTQLLPILNYTRPYYWNHINDGTGFDALTYPLINYITGEDTGNYITVTGREIIPRYFEYQGFIDSKGNTYDNNIVIKEEYDGLYLTTLVASKMSCTSVDMTKGWNVDERDTLCFSNDGEFYKYDIGKLSIKLNSQYDARYLKRETDYMYVDPESGYYTCVPECHDTLEDPYISYHYNSCAPFDIYTTEEYVINGIEDVTIVIDNGTPHKVAKNSYYTLPMEGVTKASEVFNITFDYQDGVTPTETKPYTKVYTPNGFKINGVHYNFGQTIQVRSSVVIETDYDVDIVGDDFPTPTRENYNFKGWYDVKIGGHIVTDASAGITRTIYAQWGDKDYVTIVRPDGIAIELEKGSEYTMPDTPYKYDDIIANVIFNLNDETGDARYGSVYKSYTKNGIICKETGTHYNIGQTIIVNENMTLLGDYNETITPAVFPNDPTREYYEFLGWYDQLEDGTKYTEYSGDHDLALYAHWKGDESLVRIQYVNGYCEVDERTGANSHCTTGSYTITVDKGSNYKLEHNVVTKSTYNVRFIFNDGETDDYNAKVIATNQGNGWYIDGVHYEQGQTIVADRDMVVNADYVEVITPAVFPKTPSIPGYVFLGWYEGSTNTYYTSYSEKKDKILRGRWKKADTYTLPEIPAKNPETVATVTLKFQDEVTKDKTLYVQKMYDAVDYTVNGGGYDNEHFNVGDTINFTEDVTITPNYNEILVEVDLLNASRDGYYFLGWFDEPEDGVKYTSYGGTDDITLYAQWTTDVITSLCKRATTLHTKGGTTYGRLGTPGELVVGDAFDCDVNGDGIYDAETERFYYVNDYYDAEEEEYNHSIASLIYYTDYMGGIVPANDTTTYTKYGTGVSNEGPTVAATYLPTEQEWSNVKLYKTQRLLTSPYKTTSNSYGEFEVFDYTGYAARMVNAVEIVDSGCVYNFNIAILKKYYNLNHTCDFLGENIRNNPKDPLEERGYWLENPQGYCKNGTNCPGKEITWAYNLIMDNHQTNWDGVHIQGRESNDNSRKKGVRPAIDVPKNLIEDNPGETILHTITYPEGNVQYAVHKSTYQFGDLGSATTEEYTVIFNYNDGETENTTSIVTAQRIPTAWKIGNTRYNKDDQMIVLDDYQLEYIYADTVTPATFPSNPTREGYTFVGWFDAEYGGNQYTSYDKAENITLYARWNSTGGGDSGDILCKRATTLHSQECQNGNAYCVQTDGLEIGDIITFGKIPEEGSLNTGDAFDCDVNGDGTFDAETERFYYVSDYFDTQTATFDSSTATLLFYSNVDAGVPSTSVKAQYSSLNDIKTVNPDATSATNIYGPLTAMKKLPTIELWSNITLKSTNRRIYAEGETNHLATSTTSGELPTNYSYEGYAARFLTAAEIMEGCDIDSLPNYKGTGSPQLSADCLFMNENTRYVYYNTSYSGGFWLENPLDRSDHALYGASNSRYVTNVGILDTRVGVGVRPTIDVPKTRIEGLGTITHTVTLPDRVDTVPHETPYTISRNTYDKESEDLATVTFVYNNGQADTTAKVQKSYKNNGFTIDDVHYDTNDVYVVLKDIELIPDYTPNVVSPEFPTPTRRGYRFEGWYDSDNTLVEEYTGTEDITLFAKWSLAKPEPGPYVLPVNDLTKAAQINTVTFKPENGEDDIVRTVTSEFKPDGWLVDGAPRAEGETITVTENTVIEPNFSILRTSAVEFPDDPVKENFEFTGWCATRDTGGTCYNSYYKSEDITLYAHYIYIGDVTPYTLGVNNQTKPDEILATITFKYHNGMADTTSNVVKTYTANGWLVDNTWYADGVTVSITPYSTIVPNFDDRIVNAQFPSNPTKDGLEFIGWFTAETGGKQIGLLNGTEDLTLHAQYTANYAILTDSFQDKICNYYGDSSHCSFGIADSFRPATPEEVSHIDLSSFTERNIISSDDSPMPIYVWPEGNERVYYSEADVMYIKYPTYLFGESGFKEIDLSGFNTIKATSMEDMFTYAEETTTIKFGDGFITSNVTNMSRMFSNCRALKNIDLSGFDTSKVTDMSEMFSNLDKMKKLDLSNFDTRNVTTMEEMFYSVGMVELDLSNFNTSNVTNMGGMFSESESLKSLDLSNFDTSKVTDMHFMFDNTGSLKELDLSSFDTSKVTNMYGMFAYAFKLKTIYVSNKWNTNLVSDSDGMFEDCENIVGQEGTVYDSSHLDKEYAHVDGGVENPGYLTMDRQTKAHYVYLPDYSEKVNHGSSYIIPTNRYDKETKISTITFDYQDGRDNTTSQVQTTYVNNGFTINEDHYDTNEVIIVLNDIYLYPDYVTTTTNAIFPEDPTREGYTFLGWFDLPNSGIKYTSYSVNHDITLYARWLKDGDYILPVNDQSKPEEVLSTITFKYHNGTEDTTSSVVKYYKPNGWLVDGVPYPNGATITRTDSTVIEPNFNEFIRNAEFPTNPTKEGYKFTGWYTEETGGDKVTVLRGTENLVLHAQYTNNYAVISASRFRFVINRINNAYNQKELIFRKATLEEYNDAYSSLDFSDSYQTTNIVSGNHLPSYVDYSPVPVYLWRDGNKLLYYSEADVIFMPEYSGSMFSYSDKVVSIDLSDLNSSLVKSLFGTFSSCRSLTEIIFGDFDTHSVEDMTSTFSSLESITSLDLSSFDTHKVRNMSNLFYSCKALTNIDMTDNFDTSNVTNMSQMFSQCTSLTYVDFSKLDTSKVQNMSGLFLNDKALVEVKFSGNDTSQVTTMKQMFNYCTSLTTVDVSGFDTRNVTDMSQMFSQCNSLTSIDVSNFDTSKVTLMSSMFYACYGLDELYVNNFDTRNVTNMSDMFGYCYGLQKLDLSNFDTRNVTDMSIMFRGDRALTSIDLSNFDTSQVTTMKQMFSGTKLLKELDLSNFDTRNVTDFSSMFYETDSLEVLDLSSFVTDEEDNYNDMFYGQDNIKTVYVSKQWIAGESEDPSHNRVFYKNNNIVGQMGTTFDSQKVDKTYARIDEGESKPGYFSIKSAHTITYPDFVEAVPHGTKFSIPNNTYDKEPINLATVTFVYGDGREDVESPVQNEFVKYGFTIDDIHYDTGDIYIVNKDITLVPDYVEMTKGVTFPSNPTRERYLFVGWFTDPTDGTQVTEYTEDEDITLYAHWNHDDREEYILPVNDQTKADEVISTVTFKYHNDVTADTTSNVVRTYQPSGWLVDGDYYPAGTVIYKNDSTVIEPRFVEIIKSATFPTDPTKEGYEFVGWFTSETGGTQVTTLRSTTDITLHAQYTDSYAIIASFTASPAPGSKIRNLYSSYSGSDLTFKKATTAQYNEVSSTLTSDNIISDANSPHEVYVWRSGNNVLYYSDADVIYLNPNSERLFASSSKVQTYDLTGLNASKVTSFKSLFYYNTGVKNIDFTNLDTHNLVNMSEMFNNVSNIQSIDLRPLNTTNVTNMNSMFEDTSKLNSVNLTNFDTRNVTDMAEMFSFSQIASFDLSNFDTSNVTDMNEMFRGNSNVTTLDLSTFNTSNVTNMGEMFYRMSNITELDLSGFDTSNVTNTSFMFALDTNLKTVYVSDLWNMDSVTNSDYMFYDSKKIVGQEGTTYDANHIEKEYAHVDEGITNPGYLSLKEHDDPSIVHTITYPTFEDKANHGSTYILATNNIDKASENVATVTFDYNDGKTSNASSNVIKEFIKNGWIIGSTHYDDRDSIVVLRNLTVIPDYVETTVGAEFPSNPTRRGYRFEGWYNGDTKYTSYTGTSDITLTARWTSNVVPYEGILCKPASSLNIISCDSTDSYCNAHNVDSITFGSIPSGNEFETGNAFICDVNGDGNFDSNYERFYYVSDYYNTSTKEFDSSYATLVSAYNSIDGNPSLEGASYNGDGISIEGPNGRYNLPSTSKWTNVTLKEVTRYIDIHENDYGYTGEISYQGKAARMLTLEEVKAGCGNNITTEGYLDNCLFLVENTTFKSDNQDINGYVTPDLDSYSMVYVENNNTNYSDLYVYALDSKTRNLNSMVISSFFEGIRPTIDVPKDRIALKEQYVVSIDNIPVAVVNAGEEYVLPQYEEKSSEDIATVTFKPKNGSEDITSRVVKSYIPSNYSYENATYNPDEAIVVNSDINITTNYVETIIPAEFPSNPSYEDYVFGGWFTEELEGIKVTSYSEAEDITLYAHWLNGNIKLTVDGETTYVPMGYEYTVPKLTGGESITITLDQNYEGKPDDVDMTVTTYRTVNYQTINDVKYYPESIITINEDTIVNSTFGEDTTGFDPEYVRPTREGYVLYAWLKTTTPQGLDDFVFIEDLTGYHKEYDGTTLYAFWWPTDDPDEAIITVIGKHPYQMTVGLNKPNQIPHDQLPYSINFNVANNITDDVVNVTANTIDEVIYAMREGRRYEVGEAFMVTGDMTFEFFWEESTTYECGGDECPEILSLPVGYSIDGYIYKGLFTKPNGEGERIDFNSVTGTTKKYDNATLYMYFVPETENVVVTLDNEAYVVTKGLGTLPKATTKENETKNVTFINKGVSRSYNIVKSYEFDHFYVSVPSDSTNTSGDYNPEVEFNYDTNTDITSIFVSSVTYPNMLKVNDISFIGWYTEPNGGEKVTEINEFKDYTLYARYDNVPVHVTIEDQSYEVDYGEEFTFPSWNDKSVSITLNLEVEDETSTQTITTTNEFISFEYNGTTYNPGDTMVVTEDRVVTVNYNESTVFDPEYVEPTLEGYAFIQWETDDGDPVDITSLTGRDSDYDGQTLHAYFESKTDDQILIDFDGYKGVIDKGSMGISDLNDIPSPLKPEDEVMVIYIDHNDGSGIIDTVNVAKTYERTGYTVNGTEYSIDSDLMFNEDSVIRSIHTPSYAPDIFSNIPEGVTGIYDANGDRVENYDNVKDGDTLYYHYELTHTITLDGEVIATVEHGANYTLPINSKSKDMDNLALVTFDYMDGRDNTTNYVRRRYVANGWTINDEAHNNSEVIVVNEDIELVRAYTDTIQGVDFPINPKRTGYEFAGWYKETTYNTKVESYDTLEDITLYAKWGRQITINEDGVISIEPQGFQKVLDTKPNKNNREFNITFKYNYEGSPADKVVTLSKYDKFTGWDVNGTFVEAGTLYTFIEDTVLTSQYEMVINNNNLPNNPTRDGYTFMGWYDSSEDGDLVDITTISSNKTVYAYWQEINPNQVTLTWDGDKTVHDRGTVINLDRSEGKTKETKLATITFVMNKEGYDNKIVYINKVYTRDHLVINDVDHDDTGEYTLNEDTVITSVYTNEVVYPELPKVNDGRFLGFYTSATGGEEVTTLEGINTNTTYYAHWTNETVTIDFDGDVYEVEKGTEINFNQGKAKGIDNISVTFDYNYDGISNKNVTFTTTYVFDYYSVNDVKYEVGEKYIANTDTVIRSMYTETESNDFEGYLNNDWDLGYKPGNEYITGWTTTRNGNTDVDFSELTGNNSSYNNKTIYAKWNEVTNDITVTIDSMDPYTVTPGEQILIPGDKVLTLDEPSNETFNITFVIDKDNSVTREVTKSYTFDYFTLNGNGKHQRDDIVTFYGDSIIKSNWKDNYTYPEMPTNDDSRFIGWFTKEEGGLQVTTLEGITEATTLYAHYLEKDYVVYFDGVAYNYDDFTTSVNPVSLGYASNEIENAFTLTLDYQEDGRIETHNYSVNNIHVGWIDSSNHSYGETINLSSETNGEHYTSMYNNGDFETVTLSLYSPSNERFIGWYTAPSGGERVYQYTGYESKTYYAQYMAPTQASVTIDDEVEIYNIGDTLTLPAAKTKEGSAITITFDPDNGESTFTKSITTSYTFEGFKYAKDNQNYNPDATFTVEEDMVFNSEFTKVVTQDTWPENPSKEGYYFLGWYTNKTSGVEVFGYNDIDSNTNLYAHYTTNPEYFITITNTVTGESISVMSGSDWTFGDSKFNKTNKEKLGTITYKFNSDGYSDEHIDYYRTSTPSGFYIGDDRTTIHSIDEVNNFTSDTDITPYYDENDIVTDSHVGIDQFDYEITNEGKTIKCFSKTDQTDPLDNEEYTCYTEYDENDGDVTVYLHWKGKKKITVTEPDGTVNIYDEGDTYNTGVNNSTKDSEGYTVTFKYQDGVTADTTQSHMTTYTANGWLINGTHVNNNTDITLEEDLVKVYDYTVNTSTITLPEPTREDYAFINWNSESNGSGTVYTNSNINKLTSDTNAYAIWATDEITISFVTNNGETINDITVAYNTPIGNVLPTLTKENERRTVGGEDVLIGFIFDGWYRENTFDNKVSTSSTFTEDTTLYANWIEDEFPYVYPHHEENFVCTGSNYIDTGIKLFTNSNNDYLKDFEVGFTIESYTPSGQVKQATFFNAKWENTTEQWPGVAFRRKDATNNLEISSSVKKVRVAQEVANYTLPLEVKIYRIDNEIYLSTDGGITKIPVQDMNGFTQFFDINSYFCAGDNGSGGIQRYVKGTISNYYIKLGDYQGTAEDLDTHTVTYPEGNVETYGHNTILELDANESTKASDIGASVTFDYNDGVTPSEIRYVAKDYTPNGFIVNGTTHYDDNSTLVVDEDKVLTYDYTVQNSEVEFPSDPTRENYTFDGWFDEDDNEVKYYDGEDDIILTAKWTGEKINVCIDGDCTVVPYGEEYTIPDYDAKDNDVIATVTFKYHNGDSDTTSTVEKSFTQTGWKDQDDNTYTSEQVITVTHRLDLTPIYEETIIPATWPAAPTKEGAEFTGWFTREEGGTPIDSYEGNRDIDVHAQWNMTFPTDFDIDSDDIYMMVGETHQIVVTFIPDGTSDTVTYTDYDNEILSIVDGLVTALAKGETTITVGLENVPDVTKTINVTIISDKLESDVYEVRDKVHEDDSESRIIIGAEVGTTLGEFKDNLLNPNEYVKIYDKDGNELSDDEIVMTGQIIRLVYNDIVVDEAIMSVRGDLNGDGYVNVMDKIELTNAVIDAEPIDSITDYPRFAAADVEEDDFVNVMDKLKLTNFIIDNIDSLNE